MTDAIDQPDVTMTGRLSTRDLPGGSSGSLRVPALVALPDGPLLLVHDHRPRPGAGAWREHGGALPDDLPNPNSLWLRRSDDAGVTWSAPQRLMPTDVGLGGVSDPSVLYDPQTGRLHLFAAAATDVGLFGAHPPSPSAREGLAPEPGTLRLLHAVSADAGITWDWEDLTALLAPTAERPDGVVGFPVSGHGLTLAHGAHAGRLVQPLVTALAPRPDGTRPVRATALLSDDAGATWFLGRDVPAPEGAGAASLAGLLADSARSTRGGPCAVVCTGGNADDDELAALGSPSSRIRGTGRTALAGSPARQPVDDPRQLVGPRVQGAA